MSACSGDIFRYVRGPYDGRSPKDGFDRLSDPCVVLARAIMIMQVVLLFHQKGRSTGFRRERELERLEY